MKGLTCTAAAVLAMLTMPAVLAPAVVTAAPAEGLPRGVSPVASVEGIDEYRLDNGMRVLLFPDASKNTATVNITYLVGSRHESYGETGMAHLLEHMVFKGTPRHPNIPDELTAHGCRPNGTTWFDRTNYFETFAATDENLAWALDMEADRMVNSFIAAKDLASEMTVVRNEFEIGENNPGEVLADRMFSTAYLWHNYGKSTIGCRADLEGVPVERLQAFYRFWYQPDNSVLVVSGKFDGPRALAQVAEKFGAIPRPSRTLYATYTREPAQDGERTVTLRRVGDTQMAGAAYHVPAATHPDFAALQVLAHVLGNTPSGRLHAALVKSGLATSVSASAWPLREPGLLVCTAEARKEADTQAIRETLLRTVEEAVTRPPTAEEVSRAREALVNEWELTFRRSERAAIELSEWVAIGDWRLMFVHRDGLKTVSPQDVQRVAAAYLSPTNRTVGLFLPTEEPERVPVPEAPEASVLAASYAGDAAIAEGETLPADPAAIEARVQRATLDSGMKVAMLPKETRGDAVNATLTLHLGDETSLQGRACAGELAARMLMRGTAHHSRQEIRDAFDRMRTRMMVFVPPAGGPTSVTVSLETRREHLAEALRLAAEVLREPAFPGAEFDLLKQEELAELESGLSDPFRKAFTAFYRHMNVWPASDPRYVMTTEERIAATQAATRDEAARFHAQFYGATAAELALVGDFDADETRKLVATLFGDWRARTPYRRVASPWRERPALDAAFETPDKESAVLVAGALLDLRDDDRDYPAMLLGNFMTGGGFLNSRLATRLRQKEGWCYRVNSRLNASSIDREGWFVATANFAPQNLGKVEAAMREEIALVLDKGFAPDEVKEARAGWMQSRQVSRGTDRELAARLAELDHVGRTLAWEAKLESSVGALEPDAIAAAMRQHIAADRLCVAKAGSFAAVAAATNGGTTAASR